MTPPVNLIFDDCMMLLVSLKSDYSDITDIDFDLNPYGSFLNSPINERV